MEEIYSDDTTASLEKGRQHSPGDNDSHSSSRHASPQRVRLAGLEQPSKEKARLSVAFRTLLKKELPYMVRILTESGGFDCEELSGGINGNQYTPDLFLFYSLISLRHIKRKHKETTLE